MISSQRKNIKIRTKTLGITFCLLVNVSLKYVGLRNPLNGENEAFNVNMVRTIKDGRGFNLYID